MSAHRASRTSLAVATVLAIVAGLATTDQAWAAAPPNDDLADATVVTLPYLATGSNVGATIEADEPGGGYWPAATVWYRINAAESTGVLVRLTQISLDWPVVVVWEAAGGGTMTQLKASETYDGTHVDSWFAAAAGSTYYLQIGAVPGDLRQGTFTLSIIASNARPSVAIDRVRFAVRPVGLDGGMTMAVYWTSKAVDGSPVYNANTAVSTDGGPWVSPGVTSSTSTGVIGKTGHVYRFRVRVKDQAGRWSDWATGEELRPVLYEETSARTAWAGTWRRVTSAWVSGGTVQSSKTAGSKVSFKFTGRAVGIVGTTSPARGRARVYVDGAYVGRVDFGRLPSNAYYSARTVRWGRTWPVAGTHRVTLVVEGTPGRPRVDIDAFTVLR